MNTSLDKSGDARMKPPFNETGTILGVNFKLLHAVLLGAVSWWIWPSDPKWWGFGMIAILLGFASVAFVIEAIRSAFKLRAAKRRWEALQALGNAPKNARLARKHDLKHGGMN